MNDERTQAWEEIHRRLQKAKDALAASWTPSPEDRRALLRSRARALAEKQREQERRGASVDVVSFMIAGEAYALESSYVDEVIPLRRYTPIPFTPPFVVGVIGHHGRIVSLIDLRGFFSLPPRGLGDLNKVLLLRSGEMSFGILADSITGTTAIFRDGLQEAVHTITDRRESYILGITSDRLIVLDGARLLGDGQIVISDTVDTAEPQA